MDCNPLATQLRRLMDQKLTDDREGTQREKTAAGPDEAARVLVVNQISDALHSRFLSDAQWFLQCRANSGSANQVAGPPAGPTNLRFGFPLASAIEQHAAGDGDIVAGVDRNAVRRSLQELAA